MFVFRGAKVGGGGVATPPEFAVDKFSLRRNSEKWTFLFRKIIRNGLF